MTCKKCTSGCSSCQPIYWNNCKQQVITPIEVLPELAEADYSQFYLLPDNTIWSLNYDKTAFINLSSTLDNATEALPPLEDADLFRMYRQGDKVLYVSSDRTDWLEL